jgi:hypothetical protein
MKHPARLEDPAVRLLALGWRRDAVDRVCALAGGGLALHGDVGRVLDAIPYEHGWTEDYCLLSAQTALMRPRIMCANAAILAYALLEAFPRVRRRLLSLYRRGPDGSECGHLVCAYWCDGGYIGAFSRSNYASLGHRCQHHATLDALACSYAAGYAAMGFTPLYYGTPRLEDLGRLDWRFSDRPLTPQLGPLLESYEYEFALEPARRGVDA